jgi:hypothetical protein
MLAVAPQRLANVGRALKGDITLTSTVTGASGGFTGPQIKALGVEGTFAVIPVGGGSLPPPALRARLPVPAG